MRGDSVGGPLYGGLLGTARRELPAEIRRMHDLQSTLWRAARRTLNVAGARRESRRPRLGFPGTTQAMPVSVRFSRPDGVETWARCSATADSRARSSRGEAERGICFASVLALTFEMALVSDGSRLSLVVRRWSAWGSRCRCGSARAPTLTNPWKTDALVSTSKFGTRLRGSSSATKAGLRAPRNANVAPALELL